MYVDPFARGLGVGRQIVKQIKRHSKEEEAKMVLLETLKPSLNHLYQTEDAEIISENNLDGHPTDVLRINLK
ncbi:GNAT family N-acetyltransferase [Legionella adelaidensis]|uniref:GNAT family N-acetyltransferase n=1 Tax=Legionella adelaidensis TaxID=45056 RepID=UPI0022771284|nr:GNAT family N-acetyltransferase [Legionella adelaidensis]